MTNLYLLYNANELGSIVSFGLGVSVAGVACATSVSSGWIGASGVGCEDLVVTGFRMLAAVDSSSSFCAKACKSTGGFDKSLRG
jgi:hypothetical protein